jgi:lysophospholipase L1-like esterase
MNFTTPIPISKSNNPIDYSSRIVSLGSCFAENMDEKFQYFKFQITTNPFGIIFNPVSIERIIERVVNQDFFIEKDIFFHNERWHCFEVHSDLSHGNKEYFIENLNQIIQSVHTHILASTHIIITLGTSWVYKNVETNQIVANCHKVPQKNFTKELLSVDTIKQSLENIVSLVGAVNQNAKFIFTVSPVRHIKDGFVENNVSKANLITAVYQNLQTKHCKLNTTYFPSYEILLDELRDYRFYAEDMLHPSQQAIDYIWEKFFENYVNEKEFSIMKEVCDIQKALQHRPLNTESVSYQNFLCNLQGKITKIVAGYPFMDF